MNLSYVARLVLVVLGGLLGSPSAQAQSGTFTWLPPVSGWANSEAFGVSSDGGIVVGRSYSSNGASVGTIWTRDASGNYISSLAPTFNANTSQRPLLLTSISADGTRMTAEQYQYAYYFSASTGYMSIGTSYDIYAHHAQISSDGSTVVGVGPDSAWRWTLSGGLSQLGYPPGTWDLMSAAGVSSDGRFISGTVWNDASPHAYRWSLTEGFRVADDLSYGGFVMTNGTNIVSSETSQVSWFWGPDGTLTLTPVSIFEGLGADDGHIIYGVESGFVWIEGVGVLSREQVFGPGVFPTTGWSLRGCSASGEFVTGGAVNFDSLATWGYVAHIPSPGALCVGGVALAWASRRRRYTHAV